MSANRFLSGLPAEERARLRPYLEPVALEFNQALVEFDQPFEHVYFLETAVTATVVHTSEGDTIEVGMMGSEGFVGLSALYGVRRSNATVLVQMAGSALRMRVADFDAHVRARGGPAYEVLLRYANFFAAAVQQHAACNATHNIESRMSRWILMTHDRVGDGGFPLTQEYLAVMLGVRRPTVSEIAQKMRESGLIDYTRGSFVVTDRPRLEERSCDCYLIIREQLERTFDGERPSEVLDFARPTPFTPA
ncbi:MAG: Crp/Fnr family transcriptional regulator [Acidobacteria bacterium]|nr:Crp/Fnr family transcriptional regulator [Acidobacteriota bacterium]